MKDTPTPDVPYKFQWDIALALLIAIFISLRFAKLLLIFITPPGAIYTNAIFFAAYPLLALIWGMLAKPLHFNIRIMLGVGLVGFGVGLYYWSGLNSLLYLALYLPVMALGFYLGRRLPVRKGKVI